MPSRSQEVTVSMVAIMETALEHIKNQNVSRHYMTLSRWHLNRKLNLFMFPFSKKSTDGNPDAKMASQEFSNYLDHTFGSQQQEAIAYFKAALEYMSDVFCTSDDKAINYRISAAFSNVIMKLAAEGKETIDGILYSSANTQAKGLNVVLRKECIDDKSLVCDYVQMYAFQRNPAHPGEGVYDTVSDGVVTKDDGTFTFSHIL